MLNRGFAIVKLTSGNKLLLIGRPDITWLVIDQNGELLGDFDPKTHGSGTEYLGDTSLAKLSSQGVSISGALGVAIMEKLDLADKTPYLESRAGKKVP
jgi:hypothetical protein